MLDYASRSTWGVKINFLFFIHGNINRYYNKTKSYWVKISIAKLSFFENYFTQTKLSWKCKKKNVHGNQSISGWYLKFAYIIKPIKNKDVVNNSTTALNLQLNITYVCSPNDYKKNSNSNTLTQNWNRAVVECP